MLESITLQGFKSFADKTRLDFEGGICAVIGPNGSGKSNVVEALRWATHQARSRELRAGKATELIFHGTGLKAPLGLAEVQLELRLPSGPLQVSRRIYRDGTTEQDLGGRAVRVRDIQAALRGTGLGPGGLAVIGQGEVSGVVQAEGKALLGYLQEAAGLSRAVMARQDTEQRLQEAARHLHELSLIAGQWQEHLSHLAAEAEQARTERACRLRSLALQDALSRARQEALGNEIADLKRQAAELEAQSLALSGEVQQQATQLEAAREAALTAQSQRAAQQQAQELLTAAQAASTQQQHYLQHLQREQAELQRDLLALPQQPPQEPRRDPAPLQAQLQQQREQLALLEKTQRQLQARQEQLGRQQAERHSSQARLLAQRETLQAELQELEEQQRAWQAPYQAAQQQHAQAQKQLLEAQASAEQRRLQAQQQAQEQAQQQAQWREKLAEVRAATPPLQREAQRLGESLDSYARYGEGPRRVLSSDHAGIVGSVADLLSAEARYEVALQAALGRRLEQVVVHTAEDARELIALLRRQGGRATFLPLDLLRVRPRRDGAFMAARGVLGNLADLCPSDPPQVAEALLADTLLLADLEAATALARQYPSRPRLVTLDGELLEPGGALTGGRARDNGFSVLADQRRYAELQAELQDLARREKELLAAQPILPVQPSAAPTLEPLQAAEQEAARQLARLEAAGNATQQRLAQVQVALAHLPAPPTTDLATEPQQDPEATRAELRRLEETLAQARSEERTLADALAQVRGAAAAWQAYTTAEEQRQQLAARLERNAAALLGQQEQLALSMQEVARREQECQALPSSGWQEAQQRSQELAQRYSNTLARQNRLRAQLEEVQLSAARREGSRQPLPDGALLPGDPRHWQSELTALRQQLEAIGMVNALAEQEHAAQQERLQELQGQMHDAQQAADELQLHLQQLWQEESSATNSAYARVNSAFAEYSRELLGGEGLLEAERNEAGTLTGLRLNVQPRGKRTRNLNLLSAGERTMAGLGFLFALNHASETQGLPLAVLDEVDAPLDEANIRRFTHFLQVFAARGAQFILVTHQKATMEVAATIWGVTTDASGASKLLSIRDR